MRSPELPEHVADSEQRKERGELNLDLRGLVRSLNVIGRGNAREVASKTEGVESVWIKDRTTKRNYRLIVDNGAISIEEG